MFSGIKRSEGRLDSPALFAVRCENLPQGVASLHTARISFPKDAMVVLQLCQAAVQSMYVISQGAGLPGNRLAILPT